MSTDVSSVDDIDLASRAFWAQDAVARDAAFAVLRRERPVARFRAADSTLLPPEEDSPGLLGRDAARRRAPTSPATPTSSARARA